MEYTTNLNLKKPDVNEYYDIEKNNENMDLIDEAVCELNKNSKKMSGYNGDGLSTSRTITIAEKGNILLIIGNGYSNIVTPHGAIAFLYSSTELEKFSSSSIKYNEGVLTISDNNEAFNKSGIYYKYETL